MQSQDNIVNLLWTGGWDSTFRLLELLEHTGQTIQPHYIVDPGRPSFKLEMKQMAEIRGKLVRASPSFGAWS